jgi:hypothetical protein
MPELRLPPQIPRPAWRLGFVGPLRSGDANAAALARLLRETAERLVASGTKRPLLRLVTTLEDGTGETLAALAEGLLATPGLRDALDLRFDVILPHPGAEAGNALADGWQAVQALAAQDAACAVQVLTLDGAGAAPRRIRRALGRTIMRNCDTLVVACEGGDAHAPSPEAELLRGAARHGPNLLWLRTDGGAPRLLRDTADLLRAEEAPHGDAAFALIGEEQAQALRAPETAPEPPHGLLDRWARRICPPRDPYRDFLAENDHGGGGLWCAYGFARQLATRRKGDYRVWTLPLAALLFLVVLPGLYWMVAQQPRVGGERAMLFVFGLAMAAMIYAALRKPRPKHDFATREFWRPAVMTLLAGVCLGFIGINLGMADPTHSEFAMMLLIGAAVLPMLWVWTKLFPRPRLRPDTPYEAECRASYWARAYFAPDRLATAYANRYRSTYVIVILLITLAVAMAVLGLVFAQSPGVKRMVTLLEAAMLIGIAGFVAAALSGRWHAKWVSYRLLAELCRKQEMLARMGSSLPAFEVRQAAEGSVARGAWVAWHVNALMRAAPLPQPDLSATGKQALRAAIIGVPGPQGERLGGLLQEQIAYHAARKDQGAMVARTWARWGEAAFVAAVACVALKLLPKPIALPAPVGMWLGGLAAALPAVSAGFFALRAYSEERLLAEQSQRMLHDLTQAKATLEAIRLDQPLASQDLAAESFEVAQRMLADVAGGAQLARMRVVEAG